MRKLLLMMLLYSATLWAGLGDPNTYTLAVPPSKTIPPSPFSLPVPERPSVAPTEPMTVQEPFTAHMDSLRRMKKKIRIVNAEGINGLPVLCHVQIYKTLCQANSIHILTDHNSLTIAPLERSNPSSYVAVSGFSDYFDFRIHGFTPCNLDVSCEYVTP